MRFLRELIRGLLENWTLKLTAVFLALVLWLVVRGDPGAERVITVPLEITVPRSMEIVNDRPSSVDVTLRGPAANMWILQQMACTVDLGTAEEGEHIVPLAPENIRLPRTSGLEVVGIRPARIAVDLERTITRQVPILVATRGDPAPGYDVYSKSANPGNALVTGPRSHVEDITEVSTESVSLAGRKDPVRTFVNLNLKDTMVHTNPVGPVEVYVEIGVHRRTVTVRRIPVVTDGEGFTVVPPSVTVQVLVPATFTRPLTAGDFSVTVSPPDFDDSQTEFKLKPDVRFATKIESGTIIKEVQPAEVTVRKTRKN